MTKPNAGYYSSKKDPVDLYLTYTSRPPRKGKFSRFRGVHKSGVPEKPFRVALCFQGKRYIVGLFVDELEAAKAYNKIVLKLFGDKAILNDITGNN